MRRLQALLSVFLLFSAAESFAQSDVDSLRIDVKLLDNGSAEVTEVWHIDVSDNITEWYLVKDNLFSNDMDISGLKVADETGARFVNEGEWDVDRSRQAKALRCGLVTKSDGYEVCWGVGSSGPHVYTVEYLLTNLVKGHSDLDGFNHMFVTRGQGSPPRQVSLRIWKPGTILTSDNTRVWAFGYKGEVNLLEGAVKAWTSEKFSRQSAMIVMAGFEKGMFTPAVSEERTFDQMRETAMEGSDYTDPESEQHKSFKDRLIAFFFNIFNLLQVGIFVLFGVGTVRAARKARKKKEELLGGKMKDVEWFRGVPVDGDLRKACSILEVYSGKIEEERKNLTAAYIMRLFYKGAFEIVPQNLKKPAFRIKEYKVPDDAVHNVDSELESEVFGFIKEAAGKDSILQQNELKRWAYAHSEKLYAWQQKLPKLTSPYGLEAKDVREVFGLRRFLKDFTLIQDRGVVEVGLWNNYLIFASLYGIADQVIKDFKKVCPEYFTLSQTIAAQTQEVTPVVLWDMINSTSRSFNGAASSYPLGSGSGGGGMRWGGGGGMASWGGGGGFSGGGFGGGGR